MDRAEETPTLTQVEPTPAATPRPVSQLLSGTIHDEGRFVPGTLLAGRYRVIGLLGQGGMGEVYRATDLMLGQSVALKLLPESAAKNARVLERFHGEVRVARQVSHPNVCRVYDIGETDGLPFISMEYVDGEDLAGLLKRIGRLPGDKAAETARKICAGLGAAHDRGIIHRDLKPQNVMLNRRGEVVIMDFGLAAIAEQLTGIEARNGTPAYMSPEQLKGAEVTAKSDVYALGLVIYELFSGKRPFEARDIAELIAKQESHQYAPVSTLSTDVDQAIDRVIRWCLDADPAKRPSGPLAVAAALPGGDPLAAALAAGQTPSPEMVAAAGGESGMSRRAAVICLFASLALLAAAPFIKSEGVATYWGSPSQPPDVLRYLGREHAAGLGYTAAPEDSHFVLSPRPGLIAWLKNRPGDKKWQEWLSAEAPFTSWYREHRSQLYAHPHAIVDLSNPPPITPGMVEVEVDAYGRLRGFSAVPAGPAKESPVSAEAVFHRAGLEFDKFQEIPSNTQPRGPADTVKAWRGPHPKLEGADLTVEAGWWKGHVTWFKVVWPWMKGDGSSPRGNTSGVFRAQQLFATIALLSGAIFAALLARRNWKAGRVDRTGALRIAVVQWLLAIAAWAGTMHPVADPVMVFATGAALVDAAMAPLIGWLLYLALEPALRARWPQSIVSWNRVLAGRWLDPVVWSHVLIGGVAGLAVYTLAQGQESFGARVKGLDFGGGFFQLLGTREWVAHHATSLADGIRLGLILFFMIFGLRQLLKRDWLAAIVGSAIFCLIQGKFLRADNPWLEFGIYMAVFTLLMLLLLRVGLVATISFAFFANTISTATIGTDPGAWYFPSGFASLTLLGAIVLFAFWRTLGERDLFGSEASS